MRPVVKLDRINLEKKTTSNGSKGPTNVNDVAIDHSDGKIDKISSSDDSIKNLSMELDRLSDGQQRILNCSTDTVFNTSSEPPDSITDLSMNTINEILGINT